MSKYLIIICSFLFINAQCQETELSGIITGIAEELAADEDNPEWAELFVQQLYELVENPVRINSGDEAEISRLFFLSDFQVKTLAGHVKNSGNIVSLYEVATIPGFDRQTAEWMARFISLEDEKSLVPKSSRFSNALLANIILKPGENDTAFLGSPARLLMRYRFQTGNISGGFTAEKDQGEKLFAGKPPLPDFLSANLSYTGTGVIRKIILGDFGCRYGIGTNISTGMHMALPLNSPGFMQLRNDIRQWTSSDENNFLRGIAADLSYKNLSLILFGSINKIDATTGISIDSSEVYISNLYTSGIHNKPGLIAKKDTVTDKTFGVSLTWNLKSLKTGIAWSYTGFSIPFRADFSDPQKLYSFTGSTNTILSVNYNYLIDRFLLFGEVSRCSTGALALVQGILIRPSDRFTVNFLYRSYSPGFVSFHGNGPGVSGSNSNENGLMVNLSLELAKNLFVTAGCDVVNKPWLKYRTSFPSLSKRYQMRFRYIPDEKYSFDLLYNYRSSMNDMPQEQGIAHITENSLHTLKGVARLVLSERFTATMRSDINYAGPSGSIGMLLLQDLNYRFTKIPLSIWARYCVFKTDDWNSRLYAYENDLLYSFSIPALSGEGTRSYLMLKWDINEMAEVRLKYGLTEKLTGQPVSQPGQDLKMQFRIWF